MFNYAQLEYKLASWTQ